MYERFTDQARRVVVLAQEEARALNHDYIGTEHLLLALASGGTQSDSLAFRALLSLGIKHDDLLTQVEQLSPMKATLPPRHFPYTPRAKKVLELALREALQLGQSYVGTEHLLLGTIREGKGTGMTAIEQLEVDPEVLRATLLASISESRRSTPAVPSEPAGAPSPKPIIEGVLEWYDQLDAKSKTPVSDQYFAWLKSPDD